MFTRPRPFRPPPLNPRSAPARDRRARPRRGGVVLGVVLGAALGACGGEDEGAAGGPVTYDAAAEQGAYRPDDVRLVCAEPRHDFGSVWEGAVMSHEFSLVVEGTEDLVLRATKSDCGCAAPTLEVVGEGEARTPYTMGDPLAPGTRLALGVRYDTRGKNGDLPRRIGLYCNQAAGVFEVIVQARVLPWLEVEPNELPTVVMTETEERELHLRVRSAEGVRYFLTHPPKGVPEAVRVVPTPIEPDADGRAATWDVVLHLGPGMLRGTHTYPVYLESDVENRDAAPASDGRRPFYEAVPRLAVDVVGRYRIDPSRRIFDFGALQGTETVARTLRITCLDPDFDSPEPQARLVPLRPGQAFPLGETAHVTVRPVAGTPAVGPPPADPPPAEPTSGVRAWDVQVLLDGLSEDVEATFFARLILETGHPDEPVIEVSVIGSHLRPTRPGGSTTPSVR